MKKVLLIIILSQFFCTSLWFAGNAILPDIIRSHHLQLDFLGHLTSAVQLGFIGGTLFFAVLGISDRFSPSWVFFISAVLAALFNLGISIDSINSNMLLLFRLGTGFFLAGIYPVGMKIASDYYREGLGMSLGFLVGALVLGTSFPHLLKGITLQFPWHYVIYATSALSVAGGLIMWRMVPDGPYRKPGQKIIATAFLKGFRDLNFRSAAFGYFGHMWELYAFWAFVPLMLSAYHDYYPAAKINVPVLSFLVIASGGIACALGGWIAQYSGTKKIAFIALLLSGICCVSSPFFLLHNSAVVFISFLFFWGMTVVADSPLYSTLVAKNAAAEIRGTSLTIVNCIGFSITIISIQLINFLHTRYNLQYIYMALAPGPALGLIALLYSKDK